MISIKQFLSLDTETVAALMQVIRVLIEGIGQHAIEGDAADCAQFREGIKQVSDALVDGIPLADLQARTGSVVSRLEDHNRRTARHYRLQSVELQNMVKMLTSTIGFVSAASNANVSILGEIEKQVAVVSGLDDVRIMKARLEGCLTDIRKEAERQQKDAGETIAQLNQGLDHALKGLANGGELRDTVTGLPLRPQAEAALIQSGRSGPRSYAAVMVLDRLQTLNTRFGKEAGDEILAEFARLVREQLPAQDRLFRWGGPTLLALLPRESSLELVRSEVGRLMETRMEHTVQTPSRCIMVPIAARWTVFPMMAAPRLFYQKIDNFVAIPASRDQG